MNQTKLDNSVERLSYETSVKYSEQETEGYHTFDQTIDKIRKFIVESLLSWINITDGRKCSLKLTVNGFPTEKSVEWKDKFKALLAEYGLFFALPKFSTGPDFITFHYEISKGTQ